MNTSFQFTGYVNPVEAAKAYLKAIDVTVDEASFETVAEAVGVQDCDGMVIDCFEALQALCVLGKFSIIAHKGICFARLDQSNA